MTTIEAYQESGRLIWNSLRLTTYPVGIKYIKKESEIPSGFERPSDSGNSWSLCQAISFTRKNRMCCAMTSRDNFCIPSSYGQGWLELPIEAFIQSQILNKWRKDRESEIRCQTAFSADFATKENLIKSGEHIGFLTAPLIDIPFLPDSIMFYGNPGQANHLIQALSYEGKHVITSIFNGFGEACIKGALKPFLTGTPEVIIPGSGDKGLAGMGDDEMAVAIPGELLFSMAKNLFKTGGEFNLGYPYRIENPELNHESLPGWKYLYDKMAETS